MARSIQPSPPLSGLDLTDVRLTRSVVGRYFGLEPRVGPNRSHVILGQPCPVHPLASVEGSVLSLVGSVLHPGGPPQVSGVHACPGVTDDGGVGGLMGVSWRRSDGPLQYDSRGLKVALVDSDLGVADGRDREGPGDALVGAGLNGLSEELGGPAPPGSLGRESVASVRHIGISVPVTPPAHSNERGGTLSISLSAAS